MLDNFFYICNVKLTMSENNPKEVQKIIIDADSNNNPSSIIIDSDSISNTRVEDTQKATTIIKDEESTTLGQGEKEAPQQVKKIQSNDNLIKDEETLKMLKSLSFWGKFQVIIGFISAGFLILAGLIYIIGIITIPITIVYWVAAGISIWLLT
jgi:hypothetical protein